MLVDAKVCQLEIYLNCLTSAAISRKPEPKLSYTSSVPTHPAHLKLPAAGGPPQIQVRR
jgi:hypothetical protein